MSNPFFAGVGGILSADIAVPEHVREHDFYSRVLTTGADPLWRDDLMNNRGAPIIGLGARSAAYEKLPLQWIPHIQVADVAASAERALELGGDELMRSKDENEHGQWAVLADPNGAAFGLIPVESVPADGHDGAGRIAGLDLTVCDVPGAREFYQQVVGWSAQEVEMEDTNGTYIDFDMLDDDGHARARVCHARGANQGVPPVWLVSLPVGDLAESLRRVREGGGEIIRAMRASDGACASATIADPVGVCVALVEG